MMAICYISMWNLLFKDRCYFINTIVIVYDPYGMLYTVFGFKIVDRAFCIYPFIDQFVQLINISVSKKNITRLGTGYFYVINTIKLLIGPGKFMSFYYIVFIIINTADTN